MYSKVAVAAALFRRNGEEVRRARLEHTEMLRLAMNEAFARRPQDAHSRSYREDKVWPDIPGSHLFE